MKKLNTTKLFGLFFITFLSGMPILANEWMWHGSFPWIYSYHDKEWKYWRTGKDARFYQWSQSSGGWQIYNDGEGAWQKLNAPELNNTKWQVWEANPGPYGGAFTLGKIKNAILASQSYLDLSYQRIEDLSPLSEAPHLRELFLQANSISGLSPLQNLTSLEILHLGSNLISD
ncbi:MAG: leucine-rich repeat domain-containing protein, partial [Opitutae bacterium]